MEVLMWHACGCIGLAIVLVAYFKKLGNEHNDARGTWGRLDSDVAVIVGMIDEAKERTDLTRKKLDHLVEALIESNEPLDKDWKAEYLTTMVEYGNMNDELSKRIKALRHAKKRRGEVVNLMWSIRVRQVIAGALAGLSLIGGVVLWSMARGGENATYLCLALILFCPWAYVLTADGTLRHRASFITLVVAIVLMTMFFVSSVRTNEEIRAEYAKLIHAQNEQIFELSGEVASLQRQLSLATMGD